MITRTALIALTATLALAFTAPAFAQAPAAPASSPTTAADTKADKKADKKAAAEAPAATTGKKAKNCNPKKSKACGKGCIPLTETCKKDTPAAK